MCNKIIKSKIFKINKNLTKKQTKTTGVLIKI